MRTERYFCRPASRAFQTRTVRSGIVCATRSQYAASDAAAEGGAGLIEAAGKFVEVALPAKAAPSSAAVVAAVSRASTCAGELEADGRPLGSSLDEETFLMQEQDRCRKWRVCECSSGITQVTYMRDVSTHSLSTRMTDIGAGSWGGNSVESSEYLASTIACS